MTRNSRAPRNVHRAGSTLRFLSLLLITVLSIAVAACGSGLQAPLQDPGFETAVVATVDALASAGPSLTPAPSATATVTPTASLIASPTQSPTPTAPWEDFPGPVQESATQIPPPMPQISFPSDVFNIVLLGSDARPNIGGYRTDTMMVISIDRKDDTVTMISFPRDLYVYIPGWRMDRINTADVRGGFEMTRQTILYNFGIDVDGWARASFSGFTSAIDTLGGITVQSSGFLQDECGGRIWTYGVGTYQMDGDEALCYVRMRKTSGDFDRMRRQQEVVQALFRKVLSIDGLTRLPELYNQFYNSFQTDLNVVDLLPLIPTAAEVGLDPGRIRHFSVNRDMATFWRTPGGASVLLPDRQAVLAMLSEAFGPEATGGAQ